MKTTVNKYEIQRDVRVVAKIVRTPDRWYSYEILESQPIDETLRWFNSRAEAIAWAEAEVASKTLQKQVRDEYKRKRTDPKRVAAANAKKAAWKYKLPDKDGHYLPLVILSEDGEVLGGGINPRKTRHRAADMSVGDSIYPIVVRSSDGGRI